MNLSPPEDKLLSNILTSALKTGPSPNLLHILPVGGCGQFGMNITLYVYRDRVFVVDCGIQFSDAHKPGVDSLIPDLSDLLAPFTRVEAYLITHGHEDHIGALPFIYQNWPAPIFATKWTKSLIEKKFQRHGRTTPETFIDWDEEKCHHLPEVKLRAVGVNHSIPMARALSLRFGDFHVFHSGDYKLDSTAIGEPSFGVEEVRSLCTDQPVDVFLSDSTNSMSPGFCPSESVALATLDSVFAKASSRIIATTFSSNVWRLISLIECAKKYGRRVIPFGQGVSSTMALAQQHGLMRDLDGAIADEVDFRRLPPEKVVIIATGSQAELGSGMQRIASGEHPNLKFSAGDSCIFSSRVIPGNEVYVGQMQDRIVRSGASIISSRNFAGIHVSGHGYRGDINAMLGAVRPQYFVPMHGTFSHLSACESVPRDLSATPQKTQSIENGDLLRLDADGLTCRGRIACKVDYVDAFSRVAAPPQEFRERFKIGEMGLAMVWACIDMSVGKWLVEPQIEMRGIPFPKHLNKVQWKIETGQYIAKKIISFTDQEDDFALNERVRLLFRRRLEETIGKKVVVVAQILRK